MPKFQYQAINADGTKIRGSIEADNLQSANAKLAEKGYWVLKLKNRQDRILFRDIQLGTSRVKSEHFVLFCRQLATMAETGMNIVDALSSLVLQTESKTLKQVLISIIQSMEQGSQFSQAAEKHPKVFNAIFVSMVRAGEVSGNLPEMLHRVAVLHEKEHDTKEKVTSALVYPIFMLVALVFVFILMMLFIVPNYVRSFQSMTMDLPLPTKIVVSLSDWMQQYWYWIVLGLSLPILFGALIYRTEKGRYLLDYAKIKLPVFGKLWHKQAIARFSRTFSSLFAAAVPIQTILELSSEVVGNEAIGSVILKSRDAITSGQSIATTLKKSELFPPMVAHMTAAGEISGALQVMHEKVAEFYEKDVDLLADRLKSLLEPVLLIMMAGFVGFIVLAIMLPTFDMMNTV